MNIIFLNGYLEDEEKDYVLSKGGTIDNAAQVFQSKINYGLKKYRVKNISLPFICSFSKKSKIIRYKSQNINNPLIKYINFCNIWGIRNISRYLSLKKDIKKEKEHIKKADLLIVYSLHSPFIKNLKLIKKINEKMKIIVMAPDLPQYMNLSQNINVFYKILKGFDIRIIQKNKKFIDGYIVLTKQMIEKIDEKKPFEVIDGIVKIENEIENIEFNNEKNVIMYAGTLNEKYGIMNLINSFMSIKEKNYELYICGKGEMDKHIVESCKEDSRIKFYGELEHQEVLKLMRKVDILVNPRMNQEFTKYSFPSKILEYLEQGKMVVSYKLDCFSNEYDKYIYYPEEETIGALTNKIKEIANLSVEEKLLHSIEQRKFLKEYKNAEYQAEKIVKLFKKIGG